MRILIFIFILLIYGCRENNDEITQFTWNNGDFVYIENGSWYVRSDGVSFPGDSELIQEFVKSYKESQLYKVNENVKGVETYYNIGENKIEDFRFGIPTPGRLGRYILDTSGSLYMLEGELANYQLNFNFKLKKFQTSSNSSVYFHFKPLIQDYNEVLVFDSRSKDLYHNLLRIDIEDLVPGFDGESIGEIEFKLDNGSIETLIIKKGAYGYLFNQKTPYSFLVSFQSFEALINSF